MNLELFIVRKIAFSSRKSFSAFIIRIAIAAVALSLSTMIVATSMVNGFQKEIRNKVLSFWSHLEIIPFSLTKSLQEEGVYRYQDFYTDKNVIPEARHIQVTALKGGLLKTDEDFEGIVLKGVGDDFEWKNFTPYLKTGDRIYPGSDSSQKDILISKTTADRLQLKVGDKLVVAFMGRSTRNRPFRVKGIYETGLEDFDKKYALVDIGTIQELNNWGKDTVGGFEVFLKQQNLFKSRSQAYMVTLFGGLMSKETLEKKNMDPIEIIGDSVYHRVNNPRLDVQTIKSINPGIFDWLDLQTMNELIILTLMIVVAAMVGKKHLVDTLLANGIHIRKIFAPEHGFRGETDAGGDVKSGIDSATKLPIISIYGNKKKPSADDLKDIDVVIFDIQDVGARFYTFISSLHYLMEACAENNKPLIVLDRPNPNGWYVDGPVLKKEFQSFVGVDPIPVVHGLTLGEYAQMANGEKWLTNGEQCQLTVIKCLYYDHKVKYTLPVRPSPNLPGYLSISLYPSLCFFEGTNISVGRGTFVPFQIIGSPLISFKGAFSFTPKSRPGALTPPFENQKCYGLDLRKSDNWYKEAFTFRYVIDMYDLYPNKNDFFLKDGAFFDKLCGTDEIRKMIVAHKTEKDIKASYHNDLLEYKGKRKKYLLYPDFE